jgi:superfamily II DNA or RNA helicase
MRPTGTGVGLQGLLDELRGAVDPRVWGQAVSLARDGAVVGVDRGAEELRLLVKTRTRATPYEVFLWPEESDWGCDCGLKQPCVHIVAGAIAANTGIKQGEEVPKPSPKYRVRLRYAFTRDASRLRLERLIVRPDGRTEPLSTTLAASNLVASRGDAHAEALLVQHKPGPLDEERLRRLLVGLEGQGDATLDGAPVTLSAAPITFIVKVTDEGDRFRVGLYRPPGLDSLFAGAALRDGVLHPMSYGELNERERAALKLSAPDSLYRADQAAWLVGTYLPWLEEKGLEVRVESERLPRSESLVPRVVVSLQESPEGLRVRPDLVYGDPPIARISAGMMVRLTQTVVVRNMGAERRAVREFEERTRLPVGFERVVPPGEALALLRTTLPELGVPTEGRVDMSRFRVATAPLVPSLRVGATGQGENAAFDLDVSFRNADGHADPAAVLRAWSSGRSLVPLVEGGFAPLPADWLRQHAVLLEELLEARDVAGRVPRQSTQALVELLEDTAGEVPTDLRRLRTFLEGGDGLPPLALSPDLRAELRPYQEIGVRWLTFLRDMDLHGILADDMGLGKTLQALAVLAVTPGRSLVIAPTSVLRNWEREAQRFVPGRKVCLYHGAARRLEPDAWLTLTSHALLRLDLPQLQAVDWAYVVIDEAQAIKNPESRTAQSAFALPGRHRLALTGTPVENRLEELWSLFRFLMPGLLGTPSTFRERFVRPIEAGESSARAALRRRVRPYVLRRLKRQVAQDLPPLTEVVERCAMSDAQRAVYETVRAAMRREVIDLLTEGAGGATLQILEALLRMRQVCCDPSLLPGRLASTAPSAKLDRLEELLIELVPDGHKTLVFSQWTGLLDRVEPRLRALGIDFVRLDGSTRDRQAVIDAFQDPSGPPVFLLSLKAGGTGLNLTAADYVIHLDPWWNPAVQQQATDRAWRIGQDRPVVSIRLVAEDTVEERILELQDAKRDLADAALGEAGLVHALSGAELRALFDAA